MKGRRKMISAKRYFNNNIFFTLFQKHFCPFCGRKLTRIRVSKIVNSRSPETENFDFSSVEGYYTGDVEFIWKEFFCEICEKRFTVDDLKRITKEKKAEGNQP